MFVLNTDVVQSLDGAAFGPVDDLSSQALTDDVLSSTPGVAISTVSEICTS